MTRPQGLYKGHYLIALYDYKCDDEFEAVFANTFEMSKETYNSVGCALAHYFHDKDRVSIIYHHKKCKPYLIEAFEDNYGQTVEEFSDEWFSVYPGDTSTRFIQDGKEHHTYLDDERFKDEIIRKIRCDRGELKIWLKKKRTT